MNPENRNLILAITLSMAVLFGWQVFFVGPELEREAARQQVIAEQIAAADAESRSTLADSAGGTAAMPAAGGDDATTAVAAPRITIDAPQIAGSISLAGLRIDDVVLRDYQETQAEDSPNIQLLQRTDAKLPFFAEFRWTLNGTGVALPDASTVWTADRDVLSPGAPVTFTWDNGQGLLFSRQMAIDENYLFTIIDAVRNDTGATLAFNHYGRVRRHGTPTTSGIWILHEGPIGVFDEIVSYQNYDDLADTRTDKRKAEDLTFDGSQGGWIGFSDKYWLTALIPDQQSPLNFKFSEVGAQDALYQAGYINAQAQSVASGGTLEFTTRLFAGAKKVTLLDSYGETYGLAKFDRAIDFGWFYFLTKPFFYAINWLNGVLGNFGLAVIAFTVVVKLVFFPLANKSYRSMGKMRLLSPKIQQIRERHADDRMAMNKEMMELYKKEQINPAAGCLPVLLQIPVFFALYKVLFVTIEMRHAPFFGWITDLSAPDPTSVFNVFGLLPFGVDFLPPFMQLGAWPIMMGLSMFFQMRLNPAPPDPVQARIFQFMPLIFTFLLATFPAGLVIYWTWNNLLSMAQQWYIIRSIAKEA
ncbi:MAG TPA: membrane protein insertase YidC [Alphaproteobacteria bacterium]|jgi:YidC/Oxa1 family membrane protein insertase|nr:MAG: membrane protein insertase YidC [SAR116 cluster bacterium MED-G05]HAO56790.1 membrane protein insertase YidC [Alphaproteobacteria bacterium]HBD51703.1 membrane protein insertase YidC [Alphaproteobacteria bacterium]HBP58915.1 membrane protein insertase YidC [Alphaproteobacteria bacterium]HBP72804.1 membrane protein insertase YidC [Alphaproteobacteria bacterium]|tara:strand:- start:22427 stop:24184 length:1758 start_codon:yes stop_codon:yes gene_type:complete